MEGGKGEARKEWGRRGEEEKEGEGEAMGGRLCNIPRPACPQHKLLS